MPEEKRRILTEVEKQELLAKHKDCYICLGSLGNYEQSEIQFDHIYNYADGYPQELFNFAPVHASTDLRKKNCHKDKGRKSPFEYREELRIKAALEKVHGLQDLCWERLKRLRSQIVTLKKARGTHIKYQPYGFTEHGILMLSSVLKSQRAVQVNIQIMRTFVRWRQMLVSNETLIDRLDELEENYDAKFKIVFRAIRQLMNPPAVNRKPIGFRPRVAKK